MPLAVPKNTSIFAAEFLTSQPSNSASNEAAFFVSARNINSIDCCSLSGSRFIALLTVANVGVQQSFFFISFLNRQMQPSNKNASTAKQSTRTSRATCESGIHSSNAPYQVQVIHQIIIPEKPQGLIGEKVVYNESFLKILERKQLKPDPVPECGYFIITKVEMEDNGNVMVALYPQKYFHTYRDGTNISLRNLKKYVPMTI